MQVKVVSVWRSLEITFSERLAMPDPVCLVYEHMIHVYRNPYIGRGIGNPVVNALLNQEVICPVLPILNIVNTRGRDRRKIEFHIVVLEIVTPGSDIAAEYPGCTTVFAYPAE